jgi:hypothetical protein
MRHIDINKKENIKKVEIEENKNKVKHFANKADNTEFEDNEQVSSLHSNII